MKSISQAGKVLLEEIWHTQISAKELEAAYPGQTRHLKTGRGGEGVDEDSGKGLDR